MVRVLIIDTGVSQNHSAFENETLRGFGIEEKAVTPDYNDTVGHGTAVYGILRGSREKAEIINIKLFHNEQVSEEDLIWALTYIFENVECDIINLSLGLTICEHKATLSSICAKLSEKGVIIVSAFDNNGAISYPAAFESVIGVTNDTHCRNIGQLSAFVDSPINIGANGNIQRVAWNHPEYILLDGNSLACAHVTRIIVDALDAGVRKQDIRNYLFHRASHINTYGEYSPPAVPSFSITKACIFPFNKEMHSLVRFNDLLSFSIDSVYDIKHSGRVGANTNTLLSEKLQTNFTIKNIDEIQWDRFDTLILGHTDQIQSLIGTSLINSLIKDAIAYGKNIYSLDKLSLTNSQIYTPFVSHSNVPPSYAGKLHRFSRPILSIVGTSSQQGKFTLQLLLRRMLLNQGYNVGQIGTEPTSLLYGMDYVFPMGYNSQIECVEYETIRYINFLINNLCDKKKDIILTGSQSGTVSYDYGNTCMLLIQQYLFLLGSMPDAVVLCINPYDEIEYIDRTIKFIESSVDTNVIALVVFPMDYSSVTMGYLGRKQRITSNSFQTIKMNLEHQFSIPTFMLGDNESMLQLCHEIINYFS